jgi:anaerobic ribonucleoside-triphosphate reductase activating protein
MNYIKIEKDNLLNGPGIRMVLWLAGCSHGCKNCHNPETWNKNLGHEFDIFAEAAIIDGLNKDYVSGLTLTGGDPLFPENRKEVLKLLETVKSEYPNKNIWCWTGFTIEQLIPDFFERGNTDSIEYKILSNIDVLVDGPFRQDIRENDLKRPDSSVLLRYRGSSNQRIINIKETLKERKVVTNG